MVVKILENVLIWLGIILGLPAMILAFAIFESLADWIDRKLNG